MTAASVHGVAITPARAAACRELLAGVGTAAAWAELAPLVAESERFAWGYSPEAPGEGTRHPPFGEPYMVEMPTLHALASCALGTACARCSAPIESADLADGQPLDDGWCCSACVAKSGQIKDFGKENIMSNNETTKINKKTNGLLAVKTGAAPLTVADAFGAWKAAGGLLLVKTNAEELVTMVQQELETEVAAEKERRTRMDEHFRALGGAPPLDQAEEAAAKRKRAQRPRPSSDAEIVELAVQYIKARNAKGKPPEPRGIARATGHDSAKVEALLVGRADVYKAGGKWLVGGL